MEEKIIDFKKTVYELAKDDDNVKNILAETGFKDILKPGMLATAGRFMTIPKGAAFKKIDLDTIKGAFLAHGYKIIE
jgi:hypothetical protein